MAQFQFSPRSPASKAVDYGSLTLSSWGTRWVWTVLPARGADPRQGPGKHTGAFLEKSSLSLFQAWSLAFRKDQGKDPYQQKRAPNEPDFRVGETLGAFSGKRRRR